MSVASQQRTSWEGQLAPQFATDKQVSAEARHERNVRNLEAYLEDRRRRGIPTDGLRRRNLEPHTYPTRRTA